MINNNISEQLCSPIVSKLLKEKGFNVPCSTHWEYGNGDKKQNLPPGIYIGGFVNENGKGRDYTNSELMDSYFENDVEFGEFSRPTIHLAVKWIFENWGIWISVIPDIKNQHWKPILLEKGKDDIYDTFAFSSPQEAYQAAIKYTLENLIP